MRASVRGLSRSFRAETPTLCEANSLTCDRIVSLHLESALAERFADDPSFSHLKMGFEDNTPLPPFPNKFHEQNSIFKGKRARFVSLSRAFLANLGVLPGALSTVSSRSFVK